MSHFNPFATRPVAATGFQTTAAYYYPFAATGYMRFPTVTCCMSPLLCIKIAYCSQYTYYVNNSTFSHMVMIDENLYDFASLNVITGHCV